MRRCSTFAGLVGLLSSSSLVGAQTPSGAEELWDRGVADWKAGKLETGCPAIEESYRLDPQAGALFASAECQGQWGKVFAAVQRYEAYLALALQLSQAEHGKRLARARAGVAQLKPLIPYLELILDPSLADVSVTLDGSPLPSEQLGHSLPVEVGLHRVETRLGNGVPWRVEFTLARGESRRLELEAPPPPSAPPSAVASSAVASSAVAPVPVAPPPVNGPAPSLAPSTAVAAESGSASLSPTLGWVAGGIGVAGLLVGSVAGLSVLHQKSIVEDECGSEPDASGSIACSARGWEAVERGRTRSTLATVGFGIGAVGVLAAGVLLLWPHSPGSIEQTGAWRPSLRAGPDGAWLGVTEAW
jgi:hypothetical protein